MRYRIPLKRLIKLFAIIYVVVAAIIFVSFMSFFLQKWDISQPIVLVVYTLIIIAIFPFLGFNTRNIGKLGF